MNYLNEMPYHYTDDTWCCERSETVLWLGCCVTGRCQMIKRKSDRTSNRRHLLYFGSLLYESCPSCFNIDKTQCSNSFSINNNV